MPSSRCFDCLTLWEATVFIPSHPSKTCAPVVSQLPPVAGPSSKTHEFFMKLTGNGIDVKTSTSSCPSSFAERLATSRTTSPACPSTTHRSGRRPSAIDKASWATTPPVLVPSQPEPATGRHPKSPRVHQTPSKPPEPPEERTRQVPAPWTAT